MNEPQIQPPEKSLKYISWSFKEFVAEMKKINENLEKLTKIFEKNSKQF